MIFHSLQYLVLFFIVMILYYLLPNRYRWPLLFVFSCYFYMSFVSMFVLVLLFLVLFNYLAGIAVGKCNGARQSYLVAACIIIDLGILASFKYAVISRRLAGMFGHVSALSSIGPIGLSYFVFALISYLVEIKRGAVAAEQDIGLFSSAMLFFPKLLQGPIERPQGILRQFHERHEFDFELFKSGLVQMAFGFFKKLVIADRLAILVNHCYNTVPQQNGLTMLLAAVLYSFQIFADFSGYTDIALGSARILGFRLTNNFNRPYSASSIKEFWNRWHITLSTWLRDYLFLPVAYFLSRQLNRERYFGLSADTVVIVVATMLTFAVCGMWHGAGGHYLAWGSLFGAYLSYSYASRGWHRRIRKALRIDAAAPAYVSCKVAATFLVVTMTWIFFRSSSTAQALAIIGKIARLSIHDRLALNLNAVEVAFSFALVALLLWKEKYFFVIPTSSTVRTAIIFLLIVSGTYLFGVFESNQFIYFQF